ncbi:SLBB domain-containing protein [Idiomarina sp. OT37-5b]|uniref:SLBB domain-containing protein n=1 Tax=Idiomarina sp. OT37-5b TaxID=2100422 RepID=UPI0021CB48EC|nr:SLBB domain-containing protein [Idiomarina sp. OT37-5b]
MLSLTMRFKQLIKTVSISLFFAFVVASSSYLPTVYAQQLSQDQIEQFKQLPRAQQEALARQYGVDLDTVLSNGSSRQGQQKTSTGVETSRRSSADSPGNPNRPMNELTPAELSARLSAENEELQPFGYDVLKGKPSTFSPLSNAPVPNDYLIGIGDTLRVQLYGKESASYTLPVDREGYISLTDLGPIQVAGLRYSEVQELIKATVQERMIGVQAAVSMGDIRSMQVFVIGEAELPGAYTVSSLTTVSQALVQAGGISEIGSLRNIQVKRNGKLVTEFDLYDLLMRGDNSNDVTLRAGDVVFIPARKPLVSVSGAVVRPAKYEVSEGETLADVIDFAGGLKATAYASSAQLLRYRNGQRSVQTVDLHSEERSQPIQGGDHLNIGAIGDDISDGIMLVGAAALPGYYQYSDGMTINDVLTDVNTSLLPITDHHYGLIVRKKPSTQKVEVLQFDVVDAINGATDENLALQPQDKLVLFSRYESAQAERSQLKTLLRSEDERAREEREKVIDAYRQQFFSRLVGKDVSVDLDDDIRSLDINQLESDVRSFFDKADNNDQRPESYYSRYSRHHLLQPIIYELRNQYSETGSLSLFYIDGEVRYAGVYPLPSNGSVATAIDAAGGLRESAYLQRGEITRTVISAGEATTDYVRFNLGEILSGEEDVKLSGRDQINILKIPSWQNTIQVTLGGEVQFPGTYNVRRGETLQQLVKRAGGLTEYAFVRGAVFTRADLRRTEQRQIEALTQQLRREMASNILTDQSTNIAYSDLQQLLDDMANIEAVGRLIIDLEDVLASSSAATDDIQLKDGDALYVPTVKDTVSIIGEVQLASSYRYDPNLGLQDYLERAGGLRQKGDDERIYVIRANGSIEVPKSTWFSANNLAIRPGDTIVVPLDSQYMSNMELWSTSTQIIYQVGVALAALSNL